MEGEGGREGASEEGREEGRGREVGRGREGGKKGEGGRERKEGREGGRGREKILIIRRKEKREKSRLQGHG